MAWSPIVGAAILITTSIGIPPPANTQQVIATRPIVLATPQKHSHKKHCSRIGAGESGARTKEKHCWPTTRPGSVTVAPIGTVRRGQWVDVIGTAVFPALFCELRVTYADRSVDEPQSATADRPCTNLMHIPDRPEVLGRAIAKVTAKDASGKKTGVAVQTFTVT